MKKILSSIVATFSIILLLSFSENPNSKPEEDITLRNAEILSAGETGSSPRCVVDEGRCIINNYIMFGMRVKN